MVWAWASYGRIVDARTLAGQPQSAANASHVGVHHDARREPECRTQHDIGRLAGDSSKCEQFIHGVRDLPVVHLDDSLH